MNKLTKLPQRLATVGLLGLALSATGGANAGVLANGVLEITNLLFRHDSSTGAIVKESEFAVLLATDSTDGLAVLNGTPAVGGGSVSTFPFTLDMPHVCVEAAAGTCAGYGQNNYSHIAAGYYPSVARTDTVLSGAPITFDVSDPGGGAATGANARVTGEAALNDAGSSSTQANLGLQADFVFALEATGGINFTFDADAYAIAFLGPLAAIPGSNAQASYNWSLSISRVSDGAEIFAFSPNGVLNAAAGEIADPCSLNNTASTLTPGQDLRTCTGTFSATTPTLIAGELYRFNIRHTIATDADKRLATPEPASLVLMGAGLLGMFGAMRRRRQV